MMIRAKVLSPVITAKIKAPTIRAKPDTTIVRLIDLGMSDAAVGNIAVITAVDEFGRPTQWEAADPATILGVGGIAVVGDGNAVTDVVVDPDTTVATFYKSASFSTQDDIDSTVLAALECGTF